MGEVMEINKQLRYYPAGKRNTQQDNVVAAYNIIIDSAHTAFSFNQVASAVDVVLLAAFVYVDMNAC